MSHKLKRPSKNRPPKKIFLIVSEGEETEVNYFTDLKQDQRLITVEFKIVHSNNSDPMSVVNYAEQLRKERLKQNKIDGTPKYDRVFCLIDRDQHQNYKNALAKAKKSNIEVIRSIPCFELWFLLHYRYSTKYFACYDDLLPDLTKHCSGYSKNMDIYSLLADKRETAIEHAKRLCKYWHLTDDCSQVIDEQANLAREDPNPFTEVHRLVSILITNENQ